MAGLRQIIFRKGDTVRIKNTVRGYSNYTGVVSEINGYDITVKIRFETLVFDHNDLILVKRVWEVT